jgi:hypothetical protein
MHGVRWKVKDPVCDDFVLPRTRLEQTAHDGDRSGAAHARGRFQGTGKTEDLMTTSDQNFDQL